MIFHVVAQAYSENCVWRCSHNSMFQNLIKKILPKKYKKFFTSMKKKNTFISTVYMREFIEGKACLTCI